MKKISYTSLSILLLISFGFFIPVLKAEDNSAKQSAPVQNQTAADPSGFDENWDPFQEMDRMERNMDKLLREGFRRIKNYQQAGRSFEPDTDFLDKGDKYVLSMDLPGMSKDEIQINATDSAITVSGERHTEKQENSGDGGYYRVERSSGSFRRTLPLPSDAAGENISAKYENGVLEISVPKENPKPDESTKIKIQ